MKGVIFMIITETQKKEIEQLIPDHGEALVAYGADMFRRGMVAGAVWLGVGVCCGFVVMGVQTIYEYRKSKKNHKEES